MPPVRQSLPTWPDDRTHDRRAVEILGEIVIDRYRHRESAPSGRRSLASVAPVFSSSTTIAFGSASSVRLLNLYQRDTTAIIIWIRG